MPTTGTTDVASLLAIGGPAKRERLGEAAEGMRLEMEALSLQVRDLIIAQPPVKLLGYLQAQFHVAIFGGAPSDDEERRPDKDVLKSFQFALEYAHAVWSCHADLPDKDEPLDEENAARLFDVFEKLENSTMGYCMASAAANVGDDGGRTSADIEFRAKTSWALIRGHRYQVLEGEFFDFVLAPHADALRQAYGMEPGEIASGMQDIADAMRSGFSSAVDRMMNHMEAAYDLVERTGDDLGTVIRRLQSDSATFEEDMSGGVKDMFFGGTSNLSRHTDLKTPLLDDLSYATGENTEFYEPGDFCGTPMRTLPGRVKPAIRLDGDVYATDAQFVRDSAYRAIQRGVCQRLNDRTDWLKRQALLVEQAFPTIFTNQFARARTIGSVFYRGVQTGGWAETDLLIMIDDVLLVIEAKSGNLPMQSPATNFRSHERVIQDLVVKAYTQCRRFLEYVDSAPEVALFHLENGKYTEAGRIRRGDYRVMLPIGLTVEAFTPFSAMAKELPEVAPILSRHPFMSMSVDDLFVLNRFLPTTGLLLHYLEVRQLIAGIRSVMLFDEIDHLGAYISDNRFDMTVREHLMTADSITMDSFGDVVDRYFEGPDWEASPIPSQTFPATFAEILATLERDRPAGWLKMDSFLRDFGGAGRKMLADNIGLLEPTLASHPRRRILIGEDNPLQVWLCRAGAEPSRTEVADQGQIGCLTVGAAKMTVLTLSYREHGRISHVACADISGPTILQTNYASLRDEASNQRGRMKDLRKQSKSRRATR